MWRAITEDITSGRKYRLLDDDSPITFRILLRWLEKDDEFSAWYTHLLADSDYEAFYWEHPPLTRVNLDRDCEFVLIDAVTLASLQPDPAPFRSQFADQPGPDVIVFPNLGGDATLIVPRPTTANDACAHLAAFIRHAPAAQVRSLWRCTAHVVYQNVTSAPRWLSTAGLGVAWPHVRLDTRPKYYSYLPYTWQP